MTDHGSLYQGWRDDRSATGAGKPRGSRGRRRGRRSSTGPAVRTVAGFPGGRLNTSYNCLDRHVDGGAGDRPALVWDSAMPGEVVTHTYRELRDRVAKLAGAIAAVGVSRGDPVVIYMPMVPEAAIAMLAYARLGAVHSKILRRTLRDLANAGPVHVPSTIEDPHVADRLREAFGALDAQPVH